MMHIVKKLLSYIKCKFYSNKSDSSSKEKGLGIQGIDMFY